MQLMCPHQNQPVVEAGTPLEEATAGCVLLHGRGATARGIAQLGTDLHTPGVALLAPQAARNTWYPNSFMAPFESNEPHLSAALDVVGDVLDHLLTNDIPRERVLLLGFSQGACLASEFLARNATTYGGLVAFSGGLIGPPDTPREYEGALAGTPVFLGCSDTDPHIPAARVEETAAVLTDLGADVEMRLYEGLGHTVNADERGYAAEMIAALASN